jgi:serine/threonine protein kinase
MANSTIDIDGYTILRRIGTGARSIIYLAVEEATRKRVAIKRAVLEAPEDTRIFKQIETEYKVSNEIDHPYIRKCYELIRSRKLFRTNELIMTMEFFDGQSLEDQKRLSLIDVLLIFRLVAVALNAMHEKGKLSIWGKAAGWARSKNVFRGHRTILPPNRFAGST